MNTKSFPKSGGFLVATLAFCLATALNTDGATVNVSVINDSFSPANATASVGDTVLWTWPSGSANHNVTSTSTPQAWTASATQNGPITFSHTFATAGSYPYDCTIHRSIGMIGSVTVTAAASVPPTVTITAPTTGAVFRAPATVALHATTSDSDATVTNVQFLNGTTVLANVTTAPFTTTASNLAAGNYTLTAVATDTVGLKNTNSVAIIVDAPPAVTITNPVSGTVLSAPATIAIRATAASTGGTVTNVQFLAGTAVLSNVTTAPFLATATSLAAGNYTLSAIASDNHGIATTNSVTISVVTPVATTISGLQHSPGAFHFSYAANAGLTYVIQKSTNLAAPSWVPLATNQATGSPVIFTDAAATNNPGFYRVERLPNP